MIRLLIKVHETSTLLLHWLKAQIELVVKPNSNRAWPNAVRLMVCEYLPTIRAVDYWPGLSLPLIDCQNRALVIHILKLPTASHVLLKKILRA